MAINLESAAVSNPLTRFFETLWQTAGARARQVHAAWLRRRQAGHIEVALRGLDAHVLRDLGFASSESESIAAEIVGDAEASRIRCLQTHRGLPF
jgi:uncharacterized protein YjiS (DUF1127 family)